MQESILHYIWKTQSFDRNDLRTTSGLPISILKPGWHNHDAGPDFLEARIKIDEMEWAGQIEIHVRSSEWYQHKHHTDPAYESVILHVVWSNDRQVIHDDGACIHTLELKDRVDINLLHRYENLMQQTDPIICSARLDSIETFDKAAMLERTVMERLESKASDVLSNLQENENDWEKTSYLLLARAFGLKVNAEAFEELAKATPSNLLKKLRHNRTQRMALLYGQAGLLQPDREDDYFNQLQEEYRFLKSKHKLQGAISPTHWKFSKLRPFSFPTVRIARFCLVMEQLDHIHHSLIEIEDIKSFFNRINREDDPYWSTHYDFGKKSSRNFSKIGGSFQDVIVLNVIVPLLAAYSKGIDDQRYMDKALSLLESTNAEKNSITRRYLERGFPIQNGLDSQGAIHLFKEYCHRRRCLQCQIGAKIVSSRESIA
jgi:hypothetical protein